MGADWDKIARSPTPPEPDDDDEEWPVHGIVGEDIDVFGISSYEIRWKDWSRPDGTNTTWMRSIDGDPALVASWNEATRAQRRERAAASQSMDLRLLASTPAHDRLTFERAQAAEEKAAERARTGPPGKLYRGWMAEIDRQAASHDERRGRGRGGERGGGEKRKKDAGDSSAVPRKRARSPSVGRERTREGSYAESSRLAASRSHIARDTRRKSATTSLSEWHVDTNDSDHN
ncbi:hypothetical protein F5148DRAFT_197179 [Russula earlei]|uniref:Uncharacterized protein n=1 Tax=Russula earlei TaxID=71964 RepID=A0ACC0U4S9_9AGAM|nr:hypothetical protein F5148DRAFT_197179 [Russula earlei]